MSKWKIISRMRLLLALVLITALAVIYRYALDKPWDDLIGNLIPEFVAACIAVIIAIVLLHGLSDFDQLREEISAVVIQTVTDAGMLGKNVLPLSPRQISEHLRATATDVTEYWFLGNTGTHFSVETLPRLGTVEAKSRNVSLHIQILDPESSEACLRYANDRKKQQEQVVAEIYATLLMIFVWTRTNPRLRLLILSVRPSLTHFRVDWSPRSCVITTEGRDDPALMLQGDQKTSNHLHVKVKDQLDDAYSGGRKIELPPALQEIPPKTPFSSVPNGTLESCLRELAPSRFSQAWAASVISVARERMNPYG